jgi:glutathione S-transferase
MPRPDLKAINVSYRRIPVCAIGRDVYADTRLIIQKLESLFPEKARLGSGNASPEHRAFEKLFEIWQIEADVFVRGSQLIPSDTPIVQDPKFQKDREDFSGRKWSKEVIDANRPEALAVMKRSFRLLEDTLLSDGRRWVLGTDKPSLADIEGMSSLLIRGVCLR